MLQTIGFFLSTLLILLRQHKSLANKRGIAIAPILFVISILAIIASAIAATSGSFITGTSTESSKSQAAALLQIADSIASGVQRVSVENGCTNTQISFSNPISTAYYGSDLYTNTNAPSSGLCNVFSTSGGQLVFPTFMTSVLDVSEADKKEYGTYLFVGVMGIHTSGNPQLILFIPYINKTTCQEINVLVNYPVTSSSIPYVNSVHTVDDVKFTGTFVLNGTLNDNSTCGTPCTKNINKGCLLFDNWDYGGTALHASSGIYYQVIAFR